MEWLNLEGIGNKKHHESKLTNRADPPLQRPSNLALLGFLWSESKAAIFYFLQQKKFRRKRVSLTFGKNGNFNKDLCM
jgi:hypothetical protein